MDTLYFDHAATSPIDPVVAEAIKECHHAGYANPASQHAPGRRARHRLEEARDRIAQLLGAKVTGPTPDRLIFTSGGTESNNHALRRGIVGSNRSGLLVSSIEHPSVGETAKLLQRQDVRVERIGVDSHGVLRLDELDAKIQSRPCLVSVMLGNNETGVLQPVAKIVQRCLVYDVPVHTDATQAVGKIPVDFNNLGVSLMSFSAHKFCGPVGIGGLLVRGDFTLSGLLAGQQGVDRPGTMTVALAVGMQTAMELWERERIERVRRVTNLRDQLERTIVSDYPGATVQSIKAPRLPHIANIAFLGLDRQVLQIALDRAGVACSTGSACASGSSESSLTLQAMGTPEDQVRSSLRLSLAASTTESDVVEAARRISLVCRRLQESRLD